MHILKRNFIKLYYKLINWKAGLAFILVPFPLYMVSQCNMQIIGTRLDTKQIYNIHRSQYSPSEALELLGCSDLSPDPPGLLLPLSQAEKESRNNLLSQRSQNFGATG